MGGDKNKVKEPLFYRQKPLFGFDIGHGSLKVIQIGQRHSKSFIVGYGAGYFDRSALENGEIVDYEAVAKSAYELFDKQLIGDITTRSIAASLPATSTFTRVITLPTLEKKDMDAAVRIEAEQYIPISPDNLYLDFEVVKQRETEVDLLIAAAPKNVVDSYMRLFSILNLEVVALEPSLLSVTRLTKKIEFADVPTIIIDMGSVTTDIIVYDFDSIQVTGTIHIGGLALSDKIKGALTVTEEQAHIIKSKYGIQKSKKQSEIITALTPELTSLVAEIKKVLRYHEERHPDPKSKVDQLVILGGGANLPGISDYLTNALRLPTHLSNSWGDIEFGRLQPPPDNETTLFATATGLALIDSGKTVL